MSNKTDQYLEQLRRKLQCANLSPRTVSGYCGALRSFCEWSRGQRGSPADLLERYMVALRHRPKPMAPSTVNIHRTAVVEFFAKVRNIKISGAQVPRMQRTKSLPRIHSEEGCYRLIEHTKNAKHRFILWMAYGCGLRVSELVNLRVCDFDTDRMMLRIGDAAKGRKHRDVPLDVGQVTLLTTLRGNAGQLEYVFEGQFGGPYSKRSAEKIYIAACRRISIEPHGGIHTLRHSFATHMIEAGYDVETVRRLLGHASLRTTQIYMHLSTKHMQGVKNPMARYRESRKQPKLRLCEVNVA